jgi:hypothetical protein
MADKVTVTNAPKAVVAFSGLVCVTILGALGAISSDATVALISSILGYIVGNGIAAATGKPVQPILGVRPTRSED